MSEIGDEMKRLADIDRKRFGTENTLLQILWDGQVEQECFNDTFSSLVNLMKYCIENEEFKKQLYEIDLNDYKDEDED